MFEYKWCTHKITVRASVSDPSSHDLNLKSHLRLVVRCQCEYKRENSTLELVRNIAKHAGYIIER